MTCGLRGTPRTAAPLYESSTNTQSGCFSSASMSTTRPAWGLSLSTSFSCSADATDARHRAAVVLRATRGGAVETPCGSAARTSAWDPLRARAPRESERVRSRPSVVFSKTSFGLAEDGETLCRARASRRAARRRSATSPSHAGGVRRSESLEATQVAGRRGPFYRSRVRARVIVVRTASGARGRASDGWNVTKTAMLATHLALSIAHVFAVFASRSETLRRRAPASPTPARMRRIRRRRRPTSTAPRWWCCWRR